MEFSRSTSRPTLYDTVAKWAHIEPKLYLGLRNVKDFLQGMSYFGGVRLWAVFALETVSTKKVDALLS